MAPQGCPTPVNVHDFKDPQLGKINPYGVYDITADIGWVSVGVDHDTSAFAVNTIGATTTANGAPVEAVLDATEYPPGIKIPDQRMRQLVDDGILDRHEWHGEWNYTRHPQHTK